MILPSEAAGSTPPSTPHPLTQPFTDITETTQSIGLEVIIVAILLLLAVGGVLFLACVLRAKTSRREGRDGERVYDTVEEREVIGTVRNQAYGHVGGREGTEMVRVDATIMEEMDDTVEEREVTGTVRNQAYGHVGGREGTEMVRVDATIMEEMDDTVQEREVTGRVRNQAYGHVGGGKGTEMVRVDATKMEETKGADREYDNIQEREMLETGRNEAYGHIDGGGRRKEHSTEDWEYEEI